MNLTIIRGNLTRDPEIRYAPNGNAIAQIGLAVNRRWKTSTGEQKEEVNFFDVEAYGPTADMLGKHFSKGAAILIEGRLKQDRWKDKTTGADRSKVVIVIDKWEFIDSKRDTAPATAAPRPALAPVGGPPDEQDPPF